jgi:dolichol-phosphate mannosyltransferase
VADVALPLRAFGRQYVCISFVSANCYWRISVTYTVNRTPIDLDDPAHSSGGSPANSRTSAGASRSAGTHPVRDLNNVGVTGTVGVTVVIPSRNEADNVQALLAQLAPALTGMSAEIMFVDDSDDETPAAIALHAKDCPLPVRLLQRAPGNRPGGLSGAVIAGARQAKGAWIMVMDADLQHPPEAAAALARTAMRHEVDIITGTRYAGGGGGKDGLSSIARVVTSSGATRLAKLAFPRRLAQVSDPMSGLFAWRAASIDLDGLNPVGWKLLLELLVRNPQARVAEMSYDMAPRNAGTSKASVKEGLAFLRHMVRLRRKPPATATSAPGSRMAQLLRMIAVGMIGVSGIAVNTAPGCTTWSPR